MAARLVLKQRRLGWSRTEGFRTLGWLTVPQMAVEASVRTMFKILRMKKPKTLYEELTEETNNNEDKVRDLDDANLKKLLKLSRRSWKVRCIRYYRILPE